MSPTLQDHLGGDQRQVTRCGARPGCAAESRGRSWRSSAGQRRRASGAHSPPVKRSAQATPAAASRARSAPSSSTRSSAACQRPLVAVGHQQPGLVAPHRVAQARAVGRHDGRAARARLDHGEPPALLGRGLDERPRLTACAATFSARGRKPREMRPRPRRRANAASVVERVPVRARRRSPRAAASGTRLDAPGGSARISQSTPL